MEEGKCSIVKACFDGVFSCILYNIRAYDATSSSFPSLDTFPILAFLELGLSPSSTCMGSEVPHFLPQRLEMFDSIGCKIALNYSKLYLLP